MAARADASLALDWAPVLGAFQKNENFTLTTHVRPDTDGIGSEIALHRWLSRQGKQVRILNPDAIPDRLLVLDPDRGVQPFREADAGYVRSSVVVVLDVSECDRLGPLTPHVRANGNLSICIDHHINEGRRFASIDVIEPRAPATGVLVGECLRAAGAEIDAVIASALYATIVADTGSFRFSNTTAAVMRTAADLIDLGANPLEIHRAVLGNYSIEKIRLLAATLAGAQFALEGRLAWFAITQPMFLETGAGEEDTEGLVEYLRLVRGVQAAIMFVENAPGRIKVSFRSEPGIDVNRLAQQWGGGGHRHASGATLRGRVEDLVDEVVGRARSTLF